MTPPYAFMGIWNNCQARVPLFLHNRLSRLEVCMALADTMEIELGTFRAKSLSYYNLR